MPEPSLSLADVRHVARLARLDLDEAEVDRLRGELEAVVTHLATLDALEASGALDGVEPLAHPHELTNRFANDEPVAGLPADALLRNAPAREGDYLAVPKVIGDGGGA